MTAKSTTRWAALIGVVATAAGLALAELLALLVAPHSGPLFAVGSFVIDIAPGWLTETAIALFGTNDKLVLLMLLGIVLAIIAAVAGVGELRRPPLGSVIFVSLGGLALLIGLTRAQSSGLWWVLPTLAGTFAAWLLLRALTRQLILWAAPDAAAASESRSRAETGVTPKTSTPTTSATASRRTFLTMLGGTAAGAVVVGIGARIANTASSVSEAVITAVTLPKPAVTAPPIPADAELGITGLSPVVTPNETFYRIDTALQVPRIDPAKWQLKVTGMVQNEITLSFSELLELPLVEKVATLMCVSNPVGGDLIGNATWLGYPIREIFARAKPLAGADMVLSRSIDGWTASTPLEVLQEEDREAIFAVGMNGDPLPPEHGFPVRMVVPGLYGFVSATKWVVELKVTTFAADNAFWTVRGWDAQAPIKVGSRIDVPRAGGTVKAGTVPVAGVAWQQHTGIQAVEVRVDGGNWQPARLATAISSDTWVQWVYDWPAEPGDHVLEVRATNAKGETQSGTPVAVAPNGAEGWHAIPVRVS